MGHPRVGRPIFVYANAMIELLKTLINIQSISGQEAKIGHYLLQLLREKDYWVRTQEIAQDRFNVVATLSDRARVLLCTHMDTVAPWFPFRQEGDLLYGRGACDAKGQLVCMLEVMERLRAQQITDVGLLVVVGEESTSEGAKQAAHLDVGSEFVIVGEPTENKLAIGQKGVLVFRVRASGTGGHSSLPELGESAVHKLLDLLSRWIQMDWGEDAFFGKSLLNVRVFDGGVGMNVLAPDAHAEGIFRVATSVDEIQEIMHATLPDDVTLEMPSVSGPQRMLEIPGFDTTIVGFGTDAAHLRPLGDILLYGAGSITVAHRDNEHIRYADMQTAVHDYERMVHYVLSQ